VGIEKLSLGQLKELLEDERFVLRVAPRWKKAPEQMPEGTRIGLGKCIALSSATIGVLGTAVDPETGQVITRKALAQKQLARRLRGQEKPP